MKPLTEEQAWHVVECVFSYRSGVCLALRLLRRTELISHAQWLCMTDRIPAKPGYVWPIESFGADDKPRQAFANKQANAARRRARSKKNGKK